MRLTFLHWSMTWWALLALVAPAVAASAPEEADSQNTPAFHGEPKVDGLCSGQTTGKVMLRVFRPARTYRIPPSAELLHKEGENYFIPRDSAVWKTVADRLCADLQNRQAHTDQSIARRIIVFVEGSYPFEVLSLEFPDILMNRGELLKGKFGGDNVAVHADDVRVLLDHAFAADP